MIGETITVTLSGRERNIPVALLDAYKSIGWKILGADPSLQIELTNAQSTKKRTKKETKNVEVPKR